jgi:hypothetical protein
MGIIFLNPAKVERIRDAINRDPEFKLNARLLSKNVHLGVGDSECILKICDGVITEIKLAPYWESWSFSIKGSMEAWEKMFQPVPPPFYDNLWTATQRDNLKLEGDMESAFAYLGALNRMFEIMRQLQNEPVHQSSHKNQ